MSLTSRILFTPPTTIKLSPSIPPPSAFCPLKTPSLSSNSPHPSLLRFTHITKSPSSLFARVFSSFNPTATTTPPTMGDAPDAGMDAVQRRLMFEDESVSHFSSPFSLIYIAPNASLSFLVLIVLLALIADLGYVFFSLSKTIYKEMGLWGFIGLCIEMHKENLCIFFSFRAPFC